VALVIAVFIVYVGHQREIVEAAPVVTDWCSSVCDEEVSCTEPCLVAPPELPAYEITCGEYDGGPANDWCNGDGCADECSWWSIGTDVCWWQDEETDCEGYGEFGYCEDGICIPEQGENCTTCEEDCGCPIDPVCGANGCEVGETYRTCPLDCEEPPEDTCGNDICEDDEDGDSCPDDCTFSGDWCGGFPECPDGWECLNDVCVWDTDPIFKCCGGIHDGCANTPSVCDANEACRYDDDVSKYICKPPFSTSGS
jgi:hypothetical protein